MVLTPQAPWIDHLITKTSIDMILDTPSKNGHTTGLDGLWAGVPTVSLGGGRMMEQR
jgi:predicted O-linked N-acetylglucosamine transferase (SPINDLY family)